MLAALALAGALFALGPGPAHAATTFTVNSTGDGPDSDTTDDACEVASLPPSGECTLRAAIEQANATSGADTIDFNIPGTLGVKTISPTTRLPNITDQVTINGYTQPGASPNTLAQGNNATLFIELNGGAIPRGQFIWSDGLLIRGSVSGSVVKGLVINGFEASGIRVGADGFSSNPSLPGTVIQGNFIGTDPAGSVDMGNGIDGVSSFVSNNTIGGAAPADRNVISGNGVAGVTISAVSPAGNGVGARNKIQGNYIGTDATGTGPLGNSGNGVAVFTPNNMVGGLMLSEGNGISFNGQDGVAVAPGAANTGNAILANSIYANNGLGIDLDTDGVNLNDLGDGDTGANNLQNFPVLTRVSTPSRGKTAIKGELDSTPDTIFDVQFFANPKGTDEGKTLVGRRDVSTGTDGKASFAFKLTKKVPRGQAITATATDFNSGDTSEFSAPRKVVRQR